MRFTQSRTFRRGFPAASSASLDHVGASSSMLRLALSDPNCRSPGLDKVPDFAFLYTQNLTIIENTQKHLTTPIMAGDPRALLRQVGNILKHSHRYRMLMHENRQNRASRRLVEDSVSSVEGKRNVGSASEHQYMVKTDMHRR